MRLVNLRISGTGHLGVVMGDAILDVPQARAASPAQDLPNDVRAAMASPARDRLQAFVAGIEEDDALRKRLQDNGALLPYASADIAAPIADPGLLLAIGMNYHDHLRELNGTVPLEPYTFTKSVSSIIGPYDPIVLPRSNPDMVDLEGELAIVIGTACFKTSESKAAAAIGGYTIANDVSARDWVEASMKETGFMGIVSTWGLNLLGKQFPTFCPLGPFIVTADELPDANNLVLESRINGDVLQSSNTEQMVFSSARIVAYCSQFYQLLPGDVILTGTPAGVGFAKTPKRFFQPGDIVEVEIQGLGTLRNPVAVS